MKKLFRNYTMNTWQIGFLKIYLLVGGLIIGSFIPEIIQRHLLALGALFGILLIYFLYVMVEDKI